MHIPSRKTLMILGGVLLLAALTANLWVDALANAVIDQVLIPLTRLIVGILT